MGRIDYYKRVFSAYLSGNTSQLTFWHGEPQVNENFDPGQLGEYYMPFFAKANYKGYYDQNGIPMLDYHGEIGVQYNPIAIAQFGLGKYNVFCRTGNREYKANFVKIADWLISNLEETPYGNSVWFHHFDFEYRTVLKAPWYSALAQGQGISLLVRCYKETGKVSYLDAAKEAFAVFNVDVKKGGVTFTDEKGNIWFEEYIVHPPTHILNGFIWASWGVYDLFLATGDELVKELFSRAVQTLKRNLHSYDIGFWSLYEQSGTRLRMIASPFYHHLHIVQLNVLHTLTRDGVFREYAERWEQFRRNPIKRFTAFGYKSLFKLFYY
jgi:heparosan-N-sulfate-glucuronate 5-epimerase